MLSPLVSNRWLPLAGSCHLWPVRERHADDRLYQIEWCPKEQRGQGGGRNVNHRSWQEKSMKQEEAATSEKITEGKVRPQHADN